jgi:hypothetical protein
VAAHRNALQWDGSPGHYEVWYLTLTEPRSGVGVWIRLTLLAPRDGDATCALWLVAMDPATQTVVARKATHPIAELHAAADPFRVTIAGAHLDDGSTAGRFDDVAWDLTWSTGRPYDHVDPLLARARIAQTVLTLPHGDVLVHGSIRLPGGRDLQVSSARGGQAHLYGRKHAARWAWLHAGDFVDPDGAPVQDTFVDGVSVFVPRFGREVGPSTPFVGHLLGEDFASTSPTRVFANRSHFGLTGWDFEATTRGRRVQGHVSVPRPLLAGVTYHDPDGERAYCYNSEVATIHLTVLDAVRAPRRGWLHRQTLIGERTAHFEYAQREPVAGLELLV